MAVALFASLPIAAAIAEDCQVTFSLADGVALGALDFEVSTGGVSGSFVGAGTDATCTGQVATTLEFFTLDPLAQSLRIQLLSISGFGGASPPTSLVTCRFTGPTPAAGELPINVTSAARPDLSVVAPPPSIVISSIVCGDCGNGVLNDGEQCDDANGVNGDCCSSACRYETAGTTCEDSNACTTGDSCSSNGLCIGQLLDCSALADDCNLGICQGGNCEAVPFNDGVSCNDNDGCTLGDICNGGTCTGSAVDCSADDGPCTVGTCLPDGGCVAEAIGEGVPCNDGDSCTDGDVCTFGICHGAPVDCSEFDDACTVGTCDQTLGCVAQTLPDDTACSDANNCTTGDTCNAGTCTGSAVDCSHLDAGCSIGVCDPDGSCRISPVAQGDPCDDRDPCTRNDVCSDAACAGASIDCSELDSACTVGACGADGTCTAVAANDGAACVDGDICTSNDVCNEGTCTGIATDCSALDDACTVGQCQSDGSCAAIAAPTGSTCDDGNPCTENDACTTDGCVGNEIDCSAHCGQCSLGSCDPETGCIVTPAADGTTCDDGDACTIADRCTAGSCISGATAHCDDNDPCTADVCDGENGCVFTHEESLCVEQSVCIQVSPLSPSTSEESCNNGECQTDDTGDTDDTFARVVTLVSRTGTATLQLDARLPFSLMVPRPTETGVQLRVLSGNGDEILHASIPSRGFEEKGGRRVRYAYNAATSSYVDLSGLVRFELQHNDAKRVAVISATANLTNTAAALAADDLTVELGFHALEPAKCVAWPERVCELTVTGDEDESPQPLLGIGETELLDPEDRFGARVTCR